MKRPQGLFLSFCLFWWTKWEQVGVLPLSCPAVPPWPSFLSPDTQRSATAWAWNTVRIISFLYYKLCTTQKYIFRSLAMITIFLSVNIQYLLHLFFSHLLRCRRLPPKTTSNKSESKKIWYHGGDNRLCVRQCPAGGAVSLSMSNVTWSSFSPPLLQLHVTTTWLVLELREPGLLAHFWHLVFVSFTPSFSCFGSCSHWCLLA